MYFLLRKDLEMAEVYAALIISDTTGKYTIDKVYPQLREGVRKVLIRRGFPELAYHKK